MNDLRLLTARNLLLNSREHVAGGGLLVRQGKVERVLHSRESVRRAATQHSIREEDLGACVLVPGFVNAHAHLELSDLAGRLPRTGSFSSWIQSLLATRGELGTGEQESAYREGARALARSGCTSVADIDSSGLARGDAWGEYLEVVAFREALDARNEERRRPLLAKLEEEVRAGELVALSPHSPYSASIELLQALGRLAHEHSFPVGVHWAETREESEWLELGTGPLSALLGTVEQSPGCSGLQLLHDAKLLGPRTALYHGNDPRPQEIDLVAQCGATVVHCPGSHAFFSRDSFCLDLWRQAGVRLALGTDSLASNEALDMQRELRLLRANFPQLASTDCLEMVTENGARTLGQPDRTGRLEEGGFADAVRFETELTSREDLLDLVTSGEVAPAGTWLAGRAVSCSEEA